jgi:hypothetical protein
LANNGRVMLDAPVIVADFIDSWHSLTQKHATQYQMLAKIRPTVMRFFRTTGRVGN